MISGFNGSYRTDDEARAVYSESAGIARIVPSAVAVPRSIDDVLALVRWARETSTPLVPRGSGSSMGNGAIGDGVIVDLSRLDTVGEVDAAHNRMHVGAGVVRRDADAAARRFGLQFPPDPSSGRFCTIGGMIATNASGPHTLKYGSTRPWIESLDCVFDDGTLATIARGVPLPDDVPALDRFRAIEETLRSHASATVHRGVCKESSGYGIEAYAHSGDLVDLLVGSEGTLALIVGAELRLTGMPGGTSSVLGAFPTLEAAVVAATSAREAGAAACELLDRTFLDVAAQGSSLPLVPDGSEAVLIAEVEGGDPAEAVNNAQILARCFTESGATSVTLALSIDEEGELWELRHAASPILATLGPSLTSMQFIEDGAVPPDQLPAYVRGVRHILDAHHTKGVIFGHAGDAHVHVNPLIDVERPGWRETVRAILDDVVTLTAKLGGTLSGEHGDGRLRAPLLPRVWTTEALDQFRAVKQAFDPTNLFNPGVKIARPDAPPMDQIKYDPDLPPHPPRAERALAAVSGGRAYNSFRLDLLEQVP